MPYSYGWSIVALTAVIKLATFPLTKKQAGAAAWGLTGRCWGVDFAGAGRSSVLSVSRLVTSLHRAAS